MHGDILEKVLGQQGNHKLSTIHPNYFCENSNFQ